MKLIRAFTGVILVLLAPLGLWQSIAGASEAMPTVRFVSDPWPPFLIGEEGMPAEGGLAVVLCEAIMKEMNMTLSCMLYPWNRALAMLEAGLADLTFPLLKNPERERFIAFSDVLNRHLQKIGHGRAAAGDQRGHPADEGQRRHRRDRGQVPLLTKT